MPKTTKSGAARQHELPSTLKRSPAKAQRTFAKTYDSAAAEYGDSSRAARTAYTAVKHGFEKVGDHWEPKDEKGPSASTSPGRSSMSKAELIEALDQANQRDTARARRS